MEFTTLRFPDDAEAREEKRVPDEPRLLRESEILEQLPALAGWLDAIRAEEPIAS